MEPQVEMHPGHSHKSRRFTYFLKIFVRPVLFYFPLNPLTLRLAGIFDWGAAVIMPAARRTEIEPIAFHGFHGEWIRPPASNSERIILYFHGGGFFCCGLHTHRRLVARIAARSNATAVSIAYRQLPASPLTVSMTDALDSYRWLLDQGHAPENIVIAGDSSGGFLAFTATITALEKGLPAPAGIVAQAPLTTLDHETRATYPYTRRDAYLPAHRLGQLKRLLLRGMDGLPSPAPVDRDLRGLPPVLITAGSEEALRYDAELITDRLAEANVPHRLTLWEQQVHVFQAFAGPVPEGHEAINEIADFIRELTTPPAHDAAA